MPSHELEVAALVSWLVTEGLGLVMLRSWLASGGARAARARPDGMSLPVLAAHAGLNAAGLLCWIIFVTAAAKPAAWLALVLLAPAIGLGISTVTIWTPYPGARHQAEVPQQVAASVMPDHELRTALDDESMAERLVDELLERNRAEPVRTAGWNWRPLIPAGHGVLAIATFSLAILSAVSAG